MLFHYELHGQLRRALERLAALRFDLKAELDRRSGEHDQHTPELSTPCELRASGDNAAWLDTFGLCQHPQRPPYTNRKCAVRMLDCLTGLLRRCSHILSQVRLICTYCMSQLCCCGVAIGGLTHKFAGRRGG